MKGGPLVNLIDEDAERALLGSMLAGEPEALEALLTLSPDNFGWPAYWHIWGVARDLAIAGKPTEIAALNGALQERKLFDESAVLLANIADAYVSGARVPYYRDRIVELARLRRVLRASERVPALITDAELNAEQRLERVGDLLTRALEPDEHGGLESAESLASEILERARRVEAGEASATHGAPTGIPSLDNLLGGVARGRLVVIGARSGDGKSTLAGDFALSAARSGVPVLYVALEATREEVFLGLLWKSAGVRPALVREGAIPPLELEAALAEVRALPIFLESGRFALHALLALIRRARLVKRVELVVVDYVQLVAHHVKGASRATELGAVSAALKQAALEMDVAILACAQLNKAVESREDGVPRLSDIRESEAIAHDSDQVLLLARPDHTKAGLPFLRVAKNRHGRCAERIPLTYSERTNSYREAMSAAVPR